MIHASARLSARWLPLERIVVTQHEPRDLERVRYYLDLLRQEPDTYCGPALTVRALDRRRFELLDGHHRFMALVLAGRDRAPCTIIG